MSAVPATAQLATQHCHNCATDLGAQPGRFCPQCGQATTLHVPTVGEFAHEFANHYIALEGKLWRTLGMLFFKPGMLTREYLQGRRERYVLPLRLFLTFSIVFFIAIKFIEPPISFTNSPAAERAAALQSGKSVSALSASERQAVAMRNAVKNGPYAAFLLLPIFTVLLRMQYAKRELNFGSHLVFAFHFHSVVFTLFLIALVIQTKAATVLAVVLGPLYLYLGLHQCYGGRWWASLLRAGTLTVLHLSIILMAVAIAVQLSV